MAIPAYNEFMRPILSIQSDGNEWYWQDVRNECVQRFALTEADCNEMLPSGTRSVVDDRVGWAMTYLRKACLLRQDRRGYNRITSRGQTLLADAPDVISVDDLLVFPEFAAFKNATLPKRPVHMKGSTTLAEDSRTPAQLLEDSHRQLRDDLAEDLITRIKQMPPAFFEKLVVDLMLKLGYGGTRADAGKTLGRSGDGGIDGVIHQDALGLDKIYLQAKRWEGSVGSPIIMQFVGGLQGRNADRGVLITTSSFTPDAIKYAENVSKNIILIDGARLAELMIESELAIAVETTYKVWRVDQDYFSPDL